MSEFSYSNEFYDSCYNQFNPYNFTPNFYGYFNNNYCTNNSDFTPQNFQNDNEPSPFEKRIESLLNPFQSTNDSYPCNNSFQNSNNDSGFGTQSFQNNQNLNSLQNSNEFDYNPCQFNFELQNEFQSQNENGNMNHFLNEFGNGKRLTNDVIDNSTSQQIQIENFQIDEQPSTIEMEMKSLCEVIAQQNQRTNELYDTYVRNNSSQRFENNGHLNSLQNSNDFCYNQCQSNFELQNEFQIQNGNVNHFSNDFGNGNNLNCGTINNLCSQQIQNDNSQINNHKFDFVEQMNEVYNNHTDLVFETYLKQHEQHIRIQTCDESNVNPSFTQIDDFQITTFEIENNDLNEVVEKTVIELDFYSLEGEKIDPRFDLPFCENLHITTLDFEIITLNEVIDNPTKEDEFNEHAFFGIFENELSDSEGVDLDHHMDFEFNNSENVFDENFEIQIGETKHELQPFIQSTPKIIENKTTHSIFNITKFVFPNQRSLLKSFLVWFFVLKPCLAHLTRRMNRSLEDRFIYSLTSYFLIPCK